MIGGKVYGLWKYVTLKYFETQRYLERFYRLMYLGRKNFSLTQFQEVKFLYFLVFKIELKPSIEVSIPDV